LEFVIKNILTLERLHAVQYGYRQR
jgi:hypothetical protein